MKTLETTFQYLAGRAVLFTLATSLNAQTTIISDFYTANWDTISTRGGIATYTVNGQLVVTGNLPPITSGFLDNFTYVSWNRSLSLLESETIELKVDLVEADEEDVQTLIEFNDSTQGGYALAKDRDEIWMAKYRQVANGAVAPFFYEPMTIKSTNVTLVLAITREGSSAIIRSAVLDKDDGNEVLFQRIVVDTPGVDPTVSSFRGHSFFPDPGSAYLSADAVDLAVMSFSSVYESDFQLVWDDLRYRRFFIPSLNIERAGNDVLLSWPIANEEWLLERAQSVEGPWVLVDEPVTPNGGMNHVTIPIEHAEVLEVFRLGLAD